jgi:hypothetical protein
MQRKATMINSMTEFVFPLAHGPAEAPKLRQGHKIHVSTFHRWATVGCRGILLETIQVGGTRCTSREALQRFFEALTAARGQVPPAEKAGASRSYARRLRDSEAASRELDRLGG